MADDTTKTVTLPLTWRQSGLLDILSAGQIHAGHVYRDGNAWMCVPCSGALTLHLTRSDAQATLEAAVLGMGVVAEDAADAARFRWLVENRERTWESTLRTDLRFSREIAWEARADDADTSIRDLIDDDMAREKNDAT